MSVRVEHADMLEAIPRLVAEGVLCDACVTDPPYHLSATVQRFGGPKGSGHSNKFSDPGTMNRVNNSDAAGATARLARGFMGQTWDGGDIAFRPETWATVATILRPGAFLLAFGGTRTYHRLACAIEDGGFVIQDCLMWLFGTGFPKRRDALKPAYEPVVLAYKPGGKRTMQIDECRIGTTVETWPASRSYVPGGKQPNGQTGGHTEPTGAVPLGRWPANVCHDGSEEVLAAFPDSAGQQYAVKGTETRRSNGIFGQMPDPLAYEPRGDSGSAARFFFSGTPDNPPCGLCGWPFAAEDGIIAGCKPVSNAGNSSSPPGIESPALPGFVQNDALVSTLLADADIPNPSSGLASNAANCLPQCHQPEAFIAAENAPDWPLSRIVQNVRSAAHLCGSCGTAIAQSLAASRRGLDPALPAFPASISETSKRILTRSLALYVANRASTDIILTTDSLRLLFGSVLPAIAENINSERSVGKVNIGSDQRRFHFSSKAQKEDRWGSRHPTIKPVELMKWLVALVCPKDGLLLDPFAGSGTSGVAALATARDCILIEREASYVADIRERMAHYEGSGRHSLASKARRQQDKPLGGLFERPYDEVADARDSYNEAARVIGERVKAGAPIPDFFLSDRK